MGINFSSRIKHGQRSVVRVITFCFISDLNELAIENYFYTFYAFGKLLWSLGTNSFSSRVQLQGICVANRYSFVVLNTFSTKNSADLTMDSNFLIGTYACKTAKCVQNLSEY